MYLAKVKTLEPHFNNYELAYMLQTETFREAYGRTLSEIKEYDYGKVYIYKVRDLGIKNAPASCVGNGTYICSITKTPDDIKVWYEKSIRHRVSLREVMS